MSVFSQRGSAVLLALCAASQCGLAPLAAQWDGRSRNAPAADANWAHTGTSNRVAARSPALKPNRPTGDPRLARFDPQTRMLIEIELREVTPAEREQWLTLLATVDADQVPFLLSTRRRAKTGRNTAATSPTADHLAARPVTASERPPTTNVTQAALNGATEVPASRTAYSPVVAESDGSATSPAAPIQERGHTTLANLSTDEATRRSASDLQSTPQAPTSSVGDEPATPAPAQRRWMAPLRGRWGDNREDTVESVPPVAARSVASEPAASSTRSDMRSSAYMNVELQRVMTLLRTELEEAGESNAVSGDAFHRRQQIQMRLLHLLADEPEQALTAIPGLPVEQQEFWVQMLWAVANELDPPADQADDQRLRQTVDLVREAERHLRKAAPLTLRNVWFCQRISSFGNYDRFGQDEFRPGQPVLVYAEVENFRSELTQDSLYRTRLRSSLEILPADANGLVPPSALPVDRRELPPTDDVCRSVRRDYFHSYRLDIPAHLPPGRYVLRLRMLDEISRKMAVNEIPFVLR
ncbi:MAG: hypothetical protein KDA75_09855 [Planctomycetaceae bacterium]|nr:hypothetical protein [Planctomycetaceae bacterium]